MDRLDIGQQLLAQLNIDAGEIGLQLRICCRTDDVAGDEWAAGDKGKRHLRRVQAVITCECDIFAGRTLCLSV